MSPTARCGRLAALIAVALVAVAPGQARAGDRDKQALLLARALAYEEALAARAGDEIRIGVLFDPLSSSTEPFEYLSAFVVLNDVSIAGLPVTFAAVPYPAEGDLQAAFTEADIDVVHVCTGLESETTRITEATRALDLVSTTGTRELVEAGVSLGVVLEEDKPTLIVNLPASKEEGSRFGAGLLGLATVIR